MRGIYTYKITLSNTTSTATSPNLQVRLNINFSAIRGLSVDLGNIRFSSDQAGNNLLYAWLESAPQGTFTQGSSLSSYTSSNVWVNLGNNIIPANGSLNIYMQVLSSGTEFDGVYWGANPLWTSTYGQYDNGANVFSFYDNFAGTNLNSNKWQTSVGTGWTVSVDNGLTISGSGTSSANGVYVNSISAVVNSGQILEGYINQGNGITGNERGMIGASSSNTVAQLWDSGGSTGDTIAGWSAGKNDASKIIQSETVLNGAYTYLQSISSNSNLNIYSTAITSSAVYTWYNYGEVTSTTSDVPPTPLYVSLSVSSSGGGSPVNMFYQWIRVRLYPPNGTDPVLTSISLLLVGNYTSASTPVPEWSTLNSKPYVIVSAKGISNGLSNIPNDGADFGPDTPGTMTSGIQEAVNYIFAQGGGKIQLLSGIFNLDVAYVQQKLAVANSYAIEIPENPDANGIMTIEIAGVASSLWDYQVTYNPSAITPVIGNAGSIIFFNGYLNAAGSVSSALFGSAPPTSANKYNNNVNILLTNLTFRTLPPTTSTQYQPSAINLDNFAGFILTNVAVDIYTADGSIPNIYTLLDNYSYGILVNPPSYGNGLAVFDNVYIVGYGYGLTLGLSSTSYPQHQHIKKIFIQFCVQGLTLGNVGSYNPKIDYADIEYCTYPVLFTNTSSIDLLGAYMTFQSGGAWSSTFWSNAKQIFTTTGTGNVYGEIDFYAGGPSGAVTPLLGGTNPQLLATLILHQMNTYGSAGLYPYTSYGVSIAGPTAGTIQEILVSHRPIMKYILYFDGYENDTANTFPIYYFKAFSSFVAITANTTGLSLELVGLTELVILTTGSTTTYSGIVILEGY